MRSDGGNGFGAADFGAAMADPFVSAIEWIGSGGTAVLAAAERSARAELAGGPTDRVAVGRGMTAYTAGIVTGSRLRGHEAGSADERVLPAMVETAARRGPDRVVAEHCDPAAVEAAGRTCALTLAGGVADPARRLPTALARLFEQGLAVGLTLAG